MIKTIILEITIAWIDRGTWEQSRAQGHAAVIRQGSCSVTPARWHPEHPTGVLQAVSVDVESQHFITHVPKVELLGRLCNESLVKWLLSSVLGA